MNSTSITTTIIMDLLYDKYQQFSGETHIEIKTIDKARNYLEARLKKAYAGGVWVLSQWTANIAIVMVLYCWLGASLFPALMEEDQSAAKNQSLIRYSIKGTLIYCLGWVIVMAIHQYYHNDYMRVLKADNRQGFKRICLLSFKLSIFYSAALVLPANHIANRMLAVLTLYIWVSQEYVRKACVFNWDSISKKKMQFVCNFSMNQGTSIVFIIAPLASVLAPELPWLPGFLTLFPILCRFTQCYVVGTYQQFLNSIKFTLNLIGFSYSVVGMPLHSHYWRIAAAAYSLYWDVFRDWKWKIRFLEKKKFRVDLPLHWLVVGFLYDVFGRTIWVVIPMVTQDRGVVEMTRRLAWDVLRIEREQVFYFRKPGRNTVPNLNSEAVDLERIS